MENKEKKWMNVRKIIRKKSKSDKTEKKDVEEEKTL